MKNTEYCNKVRKDREDASQRHNALLRKNEELGEEREMKAIEKALASLEVSAEGVHEDIVINRKSSLRAMKNLIFILEGDKECERDTHWDVGEVVSRLEHLYKNEVEYRRQMETIKKVKYYAKQEEVE